MGEWIQPVTLSGTHVRLEPLARDHVPGLQQAAADGELWNLWYTSVPAPADTAAYVDRALALQGQGLALPFVVKGRSSAARASATSTRTTAASRSAGRGTRSACSARR